MSLLWVSKSLTYFDFRIILQSLLSSSIPHIYLYVEAIIREGNQYFKRNQYEKAAQTYEFAAHWSENELEDNRLSYEAYQLAISSWLSACKPVEACKLIESFPQELKLGILKEIKSKVLFVIDDLLKKKIYKLATEFLNNFIQLYRLNNLFSELHELNDKQLYVLKLMTKSPKKFRKIIKENA